MKRLFFLVAFLIFQLTCFSQDVLPKPAPHRLVTDKAKLLSTTQKEYIEKTLVAFADSTTIQLAVVTIPSLNGVKLESYATKLFNAWGIGQKNKNNGLLILVAAKERKVRIEVGKGLEEYVTNEEAAVIIKEDIVPFFKKEQYYTGLLKSIDALCKEVLPSVKDYNKIEQKEKVEASPSFSPDFSSKSEVSTGAKWGLGGLIFAAFGGLLIAIARVFRWVFPGWDYGRYHHIHDSSWYTTDNTFTSSDSSSSDTGSMSDFGGGDSSGSGSSDNW